MRFVFIPHPRSLFISTKQDSDKALLIFNGSTIRTILLGKKGEFSGLIGPGIKKMFL